MPYRDTIEFIPNTAYNFMPPIVWENNEWNRAIKKCGIIAEETCLTVDPDDQINIQFRPRYYLANNVLNGPNYMDETTGVVSGSVLAPGIGNRAKPGMLIINMTTGASTYVVSVTNLNQVTVSADIFPNVGDTVWMSGFKSTTGWYLAQDGLGGLNICRNSLPLSSGLTYTSGLITDQAYFVTLKVVGYVSGYANVVLGNNTIGRIDGNGTFEFHGICRGGGSDFTITTQSGNFVGCISLDSMEVHQVNVSYKFALLNRDLNPITAFADTDITSFYEDPLTRGILVWIGSPRMWREIMPDCGCVYLAIVQEPDDVSCTTSGSGILGNWDFHSFQNWTANNPTVSYNEISPNNGRLKFQDAKNGDSATFRGGLLNWHCPPACGLEYRLTFVVSNYVSGSIRFFGFGTEGETIVNGNGTYSVNLFINESQPCSLDFSIKASGGLTNTTMEIDQVRVYYAAGQFIPLGRSELLCVCLPEPCNLKISYRNDVDSFGYSYEVDVDYRNVINVCGRLRNARMQDNEYLSNKGPDGTYSAIYADLDAVEELVTEWMPNYQAKALHVAMRHSDITINEVPYVSLGNIEAETSDDTELVRLVFAVAKKDQSHTLMYRS